MRRKYRKRKRKKIKNYLLYLLTVIILGCATVPQFNCNIPEGIEYICYSDSECTEYIKGYSAVLSHRFKSGWYQKEEVQIIHINLFADHTGVQLLGKIEAEQHEDGRIYVKVWTETYDLECNLLEKSYDEGYRKCLKDPVSKEK